MQAALDRFIEASPATRGGKPLIAGTRITVSDVALMHLRMGLALEQIAARYDLPMAGVHAAMAFYYDHRDEIEASMEDEHRRIESLRAAATSRVQAKLKAMGGE